ncbi:MAG: hypothetical protein Q9187_007540 [Circinaria calcarea]
MEPLTLTFGVEFEFILAYFPKGPVPFRGRKGKDGQGQAEQAPKKRRFPSASSSPEKTASSSSSSEYTEERYHAEQQEHHLQRAKLIPVLRAAGIPVHDSQDEPNRDQDQGYDRWTVTGDASVTPDAKHERDMAITWANGMTTRLTRAQRRVLRFTDVEIASRVLPYCRFLSGNRNRALDAHLALPRLRARERRAARAHWQSEQGLPAAHAAEPHHAGGLLREPAQRDPPGGPARQPPADRDLWKMAEILDGQESVAQLVNVWQLARGSLLSNHQRCYNLTNLLYTGSKKTIEFRQHAGSLDFGVVQAWALVVGSLVSVAHEVDAAVFLDLILERGYEADFDVPELLQRLGLNVLAEFFRERLHRHPRDREFKDPFILDRSLFGGLYDTESERESGSLEESTSAEDASINSASDKGPSDQSASDENASSDHTGSEKSPSEEHYPARPGYDSP